MCKTHSFCNLYRLGSTLATYPSHLHGAMTEVTGGRVVRTRHTQRSQPVKGHVTPTHDTCVASYMTNGWLRLVLKRVATVRPTPYDTSTPSPARYDGPRARAHGTLAERVFAHTFRHTGRKTHRAGATHILDNPAARRLVIPAELTRVSAHEGKK